MPPKLNIVRKRTTFSVNLEIEKLQKEIDDNQASIDKLKTELNQAKKNYQDEKDPKLKAEYKAKHAAGAKAYTDLTGKAKEFEQKMYGLKKEYADLKVKEDEAAILAKKKEEEKAAAAATTATAVPEGDIVIETDVVDEKGNSVPLVLNYGDDYDKVVGDFVSLYGLEEEDYDDLLDQVYDVLSEDEDEYYDDDDDDEYDDEDEDDYEDDDDDDDDGDEGYDYEDDEYYEYDEESYFYDFSTAVKDPRTGENVNLRVYNTDDYRGKLAQFKKDYNVSDTKLLDDLLLRVFSGFRYVEIDTYEIDGERDPLGLFSEDFEGIINDYAKENRLKNDKRKALLKECEDTLLFYDEVWKSFSALMSNGVEINRVAAEKAEIEKVSMAINNEIMAIVTEGRKVKGSDSVRFAELSKALEVKKGELNMKKIEYAGVCSKLSGLFEQRKVIEKEYEDMKVEYKKYIPAF